jgi:hypothetical protein
MRNGSIAASSQPRGGSDGKGRVARQLDEGCSSQQRAACRSCLSSCQESRVKSQDEKLEAERGSGNKQLVRDRCVEMVNCGGCW